MSTPSEQTLRPLQDRITTSRMHLEPGHRRLLSTVPYVDLIHLCLLSFTQLHALVEELQRIGAIAHAFFTDVCEQLAPTTDPAALTQKLHNAVAPLLKQEEYYLIPHEIAIQALQSLVDKSRFPTIDETIIGIWKRSKRLDSNQEHRRLLGAMPAFFDPTHLLVLGEDQTSNLISRFPVIGQQATQAFEKACIQVQKEHDLLVNESSIKEVLAHIDLQDLVRTPRQKLIELLKASPEDRWKLGLEIQGVSSSILEGLPPDECRNLAPKVRLIRHVRGEKFNLSVLSLEQIFLAYDEIDSDNFST